MGTSNPSWIFEACILSILARKNAYAYELVKLCVLDISDATVYSILRRLEDKDFLSVSSETHNTRLRKIYSITPTGLKQLSELMDKWHTFQRDINQILSPR